MWKRVLFLIVSLFMQILPYLLLLFTTVLRGTDENRTDKCKSCVSAPTCGIVGCVVMFSVTMFIRLKMLSYKNPIVTFRYMSREALRYDDVLYFGVVVVAEVLIFLLIVFALSGFTRHKLLDYRPTDYRNLFLIGLAAMVIYSTCVISMCMEAPYEVSINEVCPHNQLIFLDDSSDTPDYVELYNPGFFVVRLDGMFLSDDERILADSCMSLDTYEIGPEGYLVLRIDKSNSGFGLSKSGDRVYLTDSLNRIVDSVEYGTVDADVSIARIPNGFGEWEVRESSPWHDNEEGSPVLDMLENVRFSADSGYYDCDFELSLSAGEGEKIFYSIDGSNPLTNGIMYENPIHVYDRSSEPDILLNMENIVLDYDDSDDNASCSDKAFIVRAVNVAESGAVGRVTSATFFVGKDEYRGKNVISVIAAPDDLYGERGIYVTGPDYDEWYKNGQDGEAPIANFEQRGKRWEIPVSVNVITSDGDVSDSLMGARTFGGSARYSVMKRLTLYSRECYDGKSMTDFGLKNFPTIYNAAIREGWANAVIPQLAQNLDVSIQETAPVSYFLNGEYMMDCYLQEKYSTDYFAERYGVDSGNVIIYKNGNLEDGQSGDERFYDELLEYVTEHDMSREDCYREFCDKIDMQSLIDHWAFRIYVNDQDCNYDKNTVLWRTREKERAKYGDCKWRWALYDLDAPEWDTNEWYNVEYNYMINTFNTLFEYDDGGVVGMPLLTELAKNSEFREQFADSFEKMVKETFNEENVSRVFGEWGEDITWKDSFFAHRAEYIIPFMYEWLNSYK